MARQHIFSGGPYEAVYGYSRAVRVGDEVHVAGTCARPPNVDGTDAGAQARDALRTITEALTAAGASIGDVVRTRIYVVDLADAEAVLEAHGEVFAEVRPAATLVQVAGLIDPALKVEIEATAIVT
jgi:enamine deaminase RidA (YjgF/YER057c/UK114 family)